MQVNDTVYKIESQWSDSLNKEVYLLKKFRVDKLTKTHLWVTDVSDNIRPDRQVARKYLLKSFLPAYTSREAAIEAYKVKLSVRINSVKRQLDNAVADKNRFLLEGITT